DAHGRSGTLPKGVQAESIAWRNDYLLGREESQKRNLPLFVYFTAPDAKAWSSLGDPQVVELLNRAFIPVKLEAGKYLAVTDALRISSFPALIVASPTGKILLQIGEPVEAASLLRQLADKNLLGRQNVPNDSDTFVTAHRKINVPFTIRP